MRGDVGNWGNIVHPLLGSCARAVLWCAVAVICVLTFVWPFAVSDSADQPGFKFIAISTLLLFLLAMLALLVERSAAKD